ncbi:DUF2799 domain-containing protein [Photobacterium galatheae]|uniref:DUF2799 domain-containing protein n=1 Tax=Photobacterium galatheae TaxID=1654360 RepID=A0A066RH41_9GAMM|nr:DUF2799 domain-containing protein [Photobacterium galatheae]KDM89745.1 hypothetical protein EA58_20900 [Photobacterium galatheae]MCM0150371.1 DUF2799 domain-containing protein [Photobacterium galatheae]
MNKRYVMPAGVALLLTLSGCSAISEEECRLGDWYQIGLVDGQSGKKSYAATYSEECAEYGVTVDLKTYLDGRKEGLKTYCTYENGTIVGQSNQSYENVCPAGLAKEFLSGYTPYRNLAQAQEKLSAYENNINNYKERLGGDSLSNDDRKTIQAALKSAKSAKERAEYEVNRFEYELAIHKIDREIGQIHQQLTAEQISDAQKSMLNQRLVKLNDKRKFYDTLSTTENTIQSIKNIADMF